MIRVDRARRIGFGGTAAPLWIVSAAVLVVAVAGIGQADEKEFSIVLAGDAIITERLSTRPSSAFLETVEVIREGDVAIANLEMLFHDFEGTPAHEAQGTHMRAAPELAAELVWAGFDMVSRANNHACDYGYDGLRTTTKHLESVGLMHAGVGETLDAARRPSYFESDGRTVALISVASTFPAHMRASNPRDGVQGRPGLNPLRRRESLVVPQSVFDAVAESLRQAGLGRSVSSNELFLSGMRLAPGSAPVLEYELHPIDVRAIERSVRAAKSRAHYVAVALHAHEEGGTRDAPAEFIRRFAHRMIDAGADVIVGHGPHVLRGIEVYRGKPIFFSLGNIISQFDSIDRFPADTYEFLGLSPRAKPSHVMPAYRQVFGGYGKRVERTLVVATNWRGGTLQGIELHPLLIKRGMRGGVNGRPERVRGEAAEEVLRGVQRLSRPYGTEVDIQGDVGLILNSSVNGEPAPNRQRHGRR